MRVYLVIISLITSFLSFANISSQKVDQALNELGVGNSVESFRLLRQAASTNNINAQYYLAQCYEHGIGTEVSQKDAFAMYRRAAERGFAPAMKDLARCYFSGIGVAVSVEKATFWQQRFDAKTVITDMPDLKAINESSRHLTFNKEETIPAEKIANSSQVNTQDNTQHRDEPRPLKSDNNIREVKEDREVVSDVDVDIPLMSVKNESTFALVIANENYQDVASVSNAHNDGEIFSRYCNKILGIPQTNIHLVKDATLNNVKREINLIKKIADVYKGEANFIVYYAGHGIPDEKSKQAYLMPVDGFPGDISTCYSLNDLYSTFGELQSKRVVFFIDACFSGTLRGDGMLASARGIAIKAQSDAPKGNTIVFSSAQGDETAYPYEEKKHGLFTYFLLKKLKESQGLVTLGELVEYVRENVKKKSVVVNGKLQTPTVNPSDDVISEWYNWKF
ncbi:MAG: hypothetical protein HDS58_01960 [Barnesiella sp.]|nr:hypothetical protein [Barnesiella sp.]